MHPSLPVSFRTQMHGLLGPELAAFEEALGVASPTSIRLNPAKPAYPTDGLEAVPWHPEGFYLAERPVFTLDPLFHAGGYYVQEASSMLIRQLLCEAVPAQRPLRILDLCAAPGGKSTLLASWMPEGSLLVANEVIRSRVGVLKENLQRWGHSRVVTCSYDPEQWEGLAGFFDVILVDAPCSGEGLFRKDPEAIREWSEEHVRLCAARQRRILSAAWPLLASGGTLLYSTCTYNTLENDENARWLAETAPLKPVAITWPEAWGVVPRALGGQAYPHRLRGEGFYVAAFRREGEAPMPMRRGGSRLSPLSKKHRPLLRDWVGEVEDYLFWQSEEGTVSAVPSDVAEEVTTLMTRLPQGVWLPTLGQIKGADFIPSHTLALSTELLAAVETCAVDKETALRFLKKENIATPNPTKGWQLLRYEGLALGWLKNLGNRTNNYLPKDWRIRMEVREV